MPLVLYFSSHEGEAISSLFDRLFSGADVVVLELAPKEGREWLEGLYDDLSQGRKTPEELMEIVPGSQFPEFEQRLYARIYRAGKTVLVEHSPLGPSDMQRAEQLYSRRISGVSLERALREYKEVLRELSILNKRRDIALARQLRVLVMDRPSSKILVVRGAGHERTLKAALEGAAATFTTYHSHEPMLLLHESVATSMLALGEEPSQLDLMKGLAEQAELRALPPTQRNIASVRQRMNALKESDLQEIVRKMINLKT